MKKFLIIFAVLIVLGIAGVAISLSTFDADRYRPLLVTALEQGLGRPVQLDRIALGWRGGVVIALRGFAIPDDAGQGEPVVRVEDISALVRFWPLLKKDVQVSSIVLTKPQVHVARDAQGRVNLLGLAALASPAAASGQTATVGTQPVTFKVALLRIEDGTVHWTDATIQPSMDIWLRALDVTVKNISLGQPMDIAARGALAAPTPNISVQGRFMPPDVSQPGAFRSVKLSVERLPLEKILPAAGANVSQVHGTLTTTFEGDLTSLNQAELMRTLTGRGTLKMADPTITNLNILREVFSKFSMLPGLMESLQARLPQEYQAKFAANDTVFAPIDVAARIQDGMLQFDDATCSTDTFTLTGSGQVGIVDHSVSIRSTLRIEPALTAAIIRSVKELQALANASGEMEIPLMLQGTAPQLAVRPDMHYIASKVIATKAVDLLDELLKKSTKSESAPSQESPNSETTPQDSGGSVLEQLLQKALEKQAAKHAESQQSH